MIGLCCHYLIPKTKRNGSVEFINGMNEKLLQLGQYQNNKYSEEKILETWIHNLVSLNSTLDLIINDKISVL